MALSLGGAGWVAPASCSAGSEGQGGCEVAPTCSGQAVQGCSSFVGNGGFVPPPLPSVAPTGLCSACLSKGSPPLPHEPSLGQSHLFLTPMASAELLPEGP